MKIAVALGTMLATTVWMDPEITNGEPNHMKPTLSVAEASVAASVIGSRGSQVRPVGDRNEPVGYRRRREGPDRRRCPAIKANQPDQLYIRIGKSGHRRHMYFLYQCTTSIAQEPNR